MTNTTFLTFCARNLVTTQGNRLEASSQLVFHVHLCFMDLVICVWQFSPHVVLCPNLQPAQTFFIMCRCFHVFGGVFGIKVHMCIFVNAFSRYVKVHSAYLKMCFHDMLNSQISTKCIISTGTLNFLKPVATICLCLVSHKTLKRYLFTQICKFLVL